MYLRWGWAAGVCMEGKNKHGGAAAQRSIQAVPGPIGTMANIGRATKLLCTDLWYMEVVPGQQAL
jgi:hypothetical protein